MPALPSSARRHYLWSAGLVERALREAMPFRKRLGDVARVIGLHQTAAAFQAQTAIAAMLAEQDIDEPAQAVLVTASFTTTLERSTAMLEQTRTDYEFQRVVSSLVQDAGRSAESVATTVRPRIGYVRYLSPPSCSRCAVLAGRVYRYSQGFQRHPGCDCTMIPTTVASADFTQDPIDLMERGLVTGLSKADRRAIADGADFNQVVNVRAKKAGLKSSGRVLTRRGRPTPEAIYARTATRDEAIEQLIAAGYVR